MSVKPPFRTTVSDVPLEQGLREEEGWVDMQVQYLINSERGGSDGLTVGRTVLPPGARHDRHLHTDALRRRAGPVQHSALPGAAGPDAG